MDEAEDASHARCRKAIEDFAREDGVDIIISTAPPIVASRYGAHGYTCPHGTTYWIEPTSEQIAQWVKDGEP